jgi:penicillin-binding protein 1A
MTTIFDDQNLPIREFAIEKRKIVESTDIPDVLKNAIIASEDNQFYSHWGINFRGVIRAILGVIFQNRYAGVRLLNSLLVDYF